MEAFYAKNVFSDMEVKLISFLTNAKRISALGAQKETACETLLQIVEAAS